MLMNKVIVLVCPVWLRLISRTDLSADLSSYNGGFWSADISADILYPLGFFNVLFCNTENKILIEYFFLNKIILDALDP